MQYRPGPRAMRCPTKCTNRLVSCLAAPAVASTPQCVDQSKWNKAEYNVCFDGYLRRLQRWAGNGASEGRNRKITLEASRRQAALLSKN